MIENQPVQTKDAKFIEVPQWEKDNRPNKKRFTGWYWTLVVIHCNEKNSIRIPENIKSLLNVFAELFNNVYLSYDDDYVFGFNCNLAIRLAFPDIQEIEMTFRNFKSGLTSSLTQIWAFQIRKSIYVLSLQLIFNLMHFQTIGKPLRSV